MWNAFKLGTNYMQVPKIKQKSHKSHFYLNLLMFSFGLLGIQLWTRAECITGLLLISGKLSLACQGPRNKLNEKKWSINLRLFSLYSTVIKKALQGNFGLQLHEAGAFGFTVVPSYHWLKAKSIELLLTASQPDDFDYWKIYEGKGQVVSSLTKSYILDYSLKYLEEKYRGLQKVKSVKFAKIASFCLEASSTEVWVESRFKGS